MYINQNVRRQDCRRPLWWSRWWSHRTANGRGTGQKHQKSTKYAVKLLYDYCFWEELDPEFENRTASDLNKLLKQFYANVRRVDGEYYNRSSMCIIRQSINRHLKQPPHSKPYDIMTGFELKEANNTFKAICKKLRKEGKGQVEHKRSI